MNLIEEVEPQPIYVNPHKFDPRVIYAVECSNCGLTDKGTMLWELEFAIQQHLCLTEEADN